MTTAMGFSELQAALKSFSNGGANDMCAEASLQPLRLSLRVARPLTSPLSCRLHCACDVPA